MGAPQTRRTLFVSPPYFYGFDVEKKHLESGNYKIIPYLCSQDETSPS